MSASWVKASLPPLVGTLPAWVVLPLPFLLFNMASLSMWLLTATIFGLAIVLRVRGRTLLWVVRRLRTRIRGLRIEARPIGYRRAMTMDSSIDEFDFDRWRSM
jgi:hypothetical protein